MNTKRILGLCLLLSISTIAMAQASGGQIRRKETKPSHVSNNNRKRNSSKLPTRYECPFAIYRRDVVWQSNPSYIKANSDIAALQAKYEEELKMMQDELTLHNNEYEKNKKRMSKKDQKNKEEELQTMYLKIQQYFKDCQDDLNKFASKKQNDINNEIGYAGLRIMNKENIKEAFSDNGVYFWNPEYCLDITNIFIKELGGNAYAAPISFKYSDNPPKIGYVFSERIPGFNPNENNEYQQSNWERLKRLSKIIAESDGYICIVDASQLTNIQAEYAVNVTYKLIEKFKQ